MARLKAKSEMYGERALIAALRRRVEARGGVGASDLRLGIGDDAAIVRVRAGEELVVTTDFSLEGVHFRRDWHAPESVGHRCLARGLSDVAAMGARPVAAFLSLAAPEELLRARRGKSWVERFFDGLLTLAEQHGCALAGGDTAEARGDACFDIVVLGAVRRGRALLRSAAKAGDHIYVTGALGGAAAELLALERSPRRFARVTKAEAGHPHLYPEPRVEVGRRLAALKGIDAAMDVSDGLSVDLAHLCEESGVAAELDAGAIPVHRLAVEAERKGWAASAMDLALHGGEDYELLFTAGPEARVPRSVAGVSVHRIGRAVRKKARGPQVMLRSDDGRERALEARGWEHFGGS
ncbi:MAG TPA: thiamine-phosphate kinase [Acidobacteriaceae bacterium]|nr:thiamine-phosphate kinase [Acidobacteriaceae bacterium]